MKYVAVVVGKVDTPPPYGGYVTVKIGLLADAVLDGSSTSMLVRKVEVKVSVVLGTVSPPLLELGFEALVLALG